MQKQDFRSLLDRYLAGKVSEAEEIQLAQLFEQSGDGEKDTRLSPPDTERMFANFSQSPRFQAPEPARKVWMQWSAAAALILAIATAMTGWFLMNKNEKPLVFKEVKTRQGQRMTMMLPDSSEITLNANSTLRYHPSFPRIREVQLSGEAYFKVHRDPSHPFRITTADSLFTEVLGTDFNINSYDHQRHTRVTVLSGRVRVLHGEAVLGVLMQQQSIAYDHATGTSTGVVTMGNTQATSWTRGEWIYDGMNTNDLRLLLHNYYGISLQINTKKALVTSASMNFHQRQGPREIVSIFCAVVGCRYKWTDATTVQLF